MTKHVQGPLDPADLEAPELPERDKGSVLPSVDSFATLGPTLDLGLGQTLPPGAGGRAPARREFPERMGRYEIHREIGRGGMGHVFEAFDPELRRTVALKVLEESLVIARHSLTRFVAEAQIGGQLDHPNIVPVHDAGVTEDGRLFFVMKKIEGESLAELISRLRGGDREEVREWSQHKLLVVFLAVCNGVAHAHDRGVLHRDLKPGNLMLGSHGEVLVADWGIARLIGAPGDPSSDAPIERVPSPATVLGAVVGTPGWMSPEQALGLLPELDARSDVWSLGAVLYALLTLRPPYEASDVLALVFRAANEDPPDPRARAPHADIHPEIAAVCLKAMSRDKASRYSSAAELAEAVQRFIEGRERQAEDARRRRQRLVLSGVALCLLTLLAIGFAMLWLRAEDSATAADTSARESRASQRRYQAELLLRRGLDARRTSPGAALAWLRAAAVLGESSAIDHIEAVRTQPTFTLSLPDVLAPVVALVPAPGGRDLVVGYENGTVARFAVSSGELVARASLEVAQGRPPSFLGSGNGGRLIFVGAELLAIDLDHGLDVSRLRPGPVPGPVVLSPDGAWLYVQDDESVAVLEIQDVGTVIERSRWRLPKDGSTLACGRDRGAGAFLRSSQEQGWAVGWAPPPGMAPYWMGHLSGGGFELLDESELSDRPTRFWCFGDELAAGALGDPAIVRLIGPDGGQRVVTAEGPGQFETLAVGPDVLALVTTEAEEDVQLFGLSEDDPPVDLYYPRSLSGSEAALRGPFLVLVSPDESVPATWTNIAGGWALELPGGGYQEPSAGTDEWVAATGPGPAQVSLQLEVPRGGHVGEVREAHQFAISGDGRVAGLTEDGLYLFGEGGLAERKAEGCFHNFATDFTESFAGVRMSCGPWNQVGAKNFTVVWQRGDETWTLPLELPAGYPQKLAMNPHGDRLAVVSREQSVWTWPRDGTRRGLLPLDLETGEYGAALICGRPDAEVAVFSGGAVVTRLGDVSFVYDTPNAVARVTLSEVAPAGRARPIAARLNGMPACLPDGGLLLGTSSGDILVLDASLEISRRVRGLHSTPVDSIAVSPSGELVASSSAVGVVQVWRRASGTALRTLQFPATYEQVVGFDGEDRLLVVGRGGEILRWTLNLVAPQTVVERSGNWTNYRVDAEGEAVPVLPFPRDSTPWLPGAAPSAE